MHKRDTHFSFIQNIDEVRRPSTGSPIVRFGVVKETFEWLSHRTGERLEVVEPCLMQCACAVRASGGDGRQHATLKRHSTFRLTAVSSPV